MSAMTVAYPASPTTLRKAWSMLLFIVGTDASLTRMVHDATGQR